MNNADRLTLLFLPMTLLLYWVVSRYVLQDWRYMVIATMVYGALRLRAHFS